LAEKPICAFGQRTEGLPLETTPARLASSGSHAGGTKN
jgi:hypothetical protein